MSKDRIIHLLSDEEIGYILTGLRVLGQRYTEQSCEDDESVLVDLIKDLGGNKNNE